MVLYDHLACTHQIGQCMLRLHHDCVIVLWPCHTFLSLFLSLSLSYVCLCLVYRIYIIDTLVSTSVHVIKTEFILGSNFYRLWALFTTKSSGVEIFDPILSYQHVLMTHTRCPFVLCELAHCSYHFTFFPHSQSRCSSWLSNPPPSIDPNDVLCPYVTIAHISANFSSDPLDKTVRSWKVWSSKICDNLAICGLGNHIKELLKGSTIIPDTAVQPIAHDNWNTNDGMAWAYICLNCATIESELLDDIDTAYKCFKALKTYHLNEGPVKQVNLIQNGLAQCVACDNDQVSNCQKIREDIHHSDVWAQLGLKAVAWAWLLGAQALQT